MRLGSALNFSHCAPIAPRKALRLCAQAGTFEFDESRQQTVDGYAQIGATVNVVRVNLRSPRDVQVIQAAGLPKEDSRRESSVGLPAAPRRAA